MEILTATFTSVATLAGIATIGFVLIARRAMPDQALKVLSSLAINIALPAMVFHNLMAGFDPRANPGWWRYPLIWCGFMAIMLILALICTRLIRTEFPREFRMALFYNNFLFIPLAILSELYGQDAPMVTKLFLMTLLGASLIFSTYSFFFGKTEKVIKLNRILNPVLLVSLCAILLKLASASRIVPPFVMSMAGMLGSMTVPLLMLVLGGNIRKDTESHGKQHFLEVTKFVICKNLVFPLVTLLLVKWLPFSTDMKLLLMLQAVVPPIISIPVFAERAGGNRQITNQYVAGSFICSIVTIPLMLWLYG